MKVHNTYYTNSEELEKFFDRENIEDSSSLLIQVFTTYQHRKNILHLLNMLDRYFPQASLIGSTTDGEIMNEKVSSGKVVLSFVEFENTHIKVAAVEHEETGYNSGKYLAEKLIEKDTKLIITFVDGLHTDGEAFLNGINAVNKHIPVVGGHAGDNFQFKDTYVFIKNRIIEKGAVAVSLSSNILNVYSDYSYNWYPIGNELTITHAEGNRVYTIDNQRAVDIYSYYLGEDIGKGLPGIGIEFPLIANRNGVKVTRTVMTKEEDGSLVFAGALQTGEKVRIGFGRSVDIIDASYRIANKTAMKPSEVIFIFSCTARKHLMGKEIAKEIKPFGKIAPVAGFFTYGEFFTSKTHHLLNQTMTFVSLSETTAVKKGITTKIPDKLDVTGASIDALTHLVNIASNEVLERTEKLKKSNQLNQKLKERMELALLGSKTSVLDWDFTNNSLYISPSWKEMLGYADEEMDNSTETWKRRVHKEDMYKVLRQLRRSDLKKNIYFENTHRLQHKQGHWVWVLGRAKILYDQKGNKIRMIGTHTDITQEKELQLKYFYQSQMIEQINDSVTTTDLKGTILSWNKGSEKTFGYSAEEMIGTNISILYQEKDQKMLPNHIENLVRTGIYNADFELLTKSKKMVPISFSLSLLRDEKGEPIGVVGINKDNTRRKEVEDALLEQKEMLHYQAHHDALTGLPNRIMFRERLGKCIQKSQKYNIGFALFFIDLDKFKDINDSLGHEIGDNVLKVISHRLQSIIRKEDDTLARLSGDEFTIIMGNLTDKNNVSLLASKILEVLEEPIYIDDNILYVSGSIGITLYPEHALSAEALLKYADTAMYNAKEDGRQTYKIYNAAMTETALAHMNMKTFLKQATVNQEFFIHYQPQVDTLNNRLIGIEALIRWNHPIEGLLEPSSFIPLAEETGLIVEMDRWMMRTAMEQISKWYKEGLDPGVLALNLSIKQLEEHRFIEELKENIRIFDFNPKWLELEITEGQMIKKPEEVIAKLNEINSLGIVIAIDDFGTGYSSLSLLKRLPINRLKIDKSFIRDILTDPDDIAIVKAIIAMSKSLKLELISEGVETSEQRDLLIANGCTKMQGYFFSYPVDAAEIKEKWL